MIRSCQRLSQPHLISLSVAGERQGIQLVVNYKVLGFPLVLHGCKGQADRPMCVEIASSMPVAEDAVTAFWGFELRPYLLLFLYHL